VRVSLESGGGVQLDLLYGDHEGGQRTIARFAITRWPIDDERPEMDNPMRATVIRYWTVDGHDPR